MTGKNKQEPEKHAHKNGKKEILPGQQDKKGHLFDEVDGKEKKAETRNLGGRERDEHGILAKKITPEDSYFLGRDMELVEQKKWEKEQEKELKMREERKKLHYMKCPKCGADLEEITFKRVSIDKCIECKGIWLDHGELQTLLGKENDLVKTVFKQFFQNEEEHKKLQ
jgi:Zn-finger nucleic acid-binding protein